MNKKLSKLKRLWKINRKTHLVLKELNMEEKYYRLWIRIFERERVEKVYKRIGQFKYTPKISVLIPVYKVEVRYLIECIQSVEKQYYTNWEICLVDDCSKDKKIETILKEYKTKWGDKVKLKFRDVNGHISETTNDALELATGEFILLLDNDDIISPNCLYEVVKVLNRNSNVDLIYSNEDKIEGDKRFFPYFKPAWNRKILKCDNYISHVGVYRKSIAMQIGGFEKGLEGAQDWDFVLRYTKYTNRVKHIPKFLYHWRYLDTSTSKALENKPYAVEVREKVKQRIGGGFYD